MTDDLKTRLRNEIGLSLESTAMEAADRIESLEKALEKVAQHDLQAIALDALRPGERIALKKKTMSNDLVNRLRDKYASPQDVAQAADRIEALEKALRYYAEKKPEDWVNHGADDGVIARAALEGKDE
jgi:hypothetical protein